MTNNHLKKLIALLLILNLGLWWGIGRANRRGLLTVAFFDVGQGDATFIETPTGRRILIDGGPGLQILERLGQIMPFYDRSLDLVVATHPDTDHITGLPEILQRYRVGGLLLGPAKWVDGTARALLAAAQEQKVPTIYATENMSINLGEGLKAKIISPPNRARLTADDNDASAVIRLSHNQADFLFTGDASGRVERRLVASQIPLESEVLKVGHHGSKTASDQKFLEVVQPAYAVISAGRDNRYGHPHPDTLKRLEKVNARIWRTDQSGTIIFQSDGRNINVKPAYR